MKADPAIDKLKAERGLPPEAEFCGYLVHGKTHDEFLHLVSENDEMVQRAFVRDPGKARRFEIKADAEKWARPEKHEWVLALFDLGPSYFVCEVSD